MNALVRVEGVGGEAPEGFECFRHAAGDFWIAELGPDLEETFEDWQDRIVPVLIEIAASLKGQRYGTLFVHVAFASDDGVRRFNSEFLAAVTGMGAVLEVTATGE